MAPLLFSSPTLSLSLSPQGHVWYSCSTVWSKHAKEHEVSTCLKGEKPLFQRGIMSKPRLQWPPSAQNRAENLPIRRAPRSAIPFIRYGCGLFLLDLFGCGAASGLDEDLTVTKHACVSLWWHWSTVLVNWNVFGIWLMCFLLRPVTHTCGGCDVLVIKSEWRRWSRCLKMPPKNTASLLRRQMEKWQDDAKDKKAMRFHSLVHFVGAYPHTDAKGGGELVHSNSLESEAAAGISMTSPQFWFRKKCCLDRLTNAAVILKLLSDRASTVDLFSLFNLSFVFQLIKIRRPTQGQKWHRKIACFCLSNNPN